MTDIGPVRATDDPDAVIPERTLVALAGPDDDRPEWLLVETQPGQDPATWVMPDSRIETGPGRLLRVLGHHQVENIQLEPDHRRAVIAGLFFEGSRRGPFLRRFATLMGLSITIAALGLMADSAAVVVGAMLVAPLMTPVLACAAALVMGWPRRIRDNLTLLIVAVAGAVLLSATIGLFARGELDPIPPEVMGRTAPNLLDLGISAAAGAAGAYAYVRKHASDALAGAAVAVALVPPIAVVGLMLQAAEYRLAWGAALLLLVNVGGVMASGAATFLVAGLVPGQRLLAHGSKIQDGMRWAAVATIIVALPLQFGQTHLLPVPVPSEDIEQAIEQWAQSTGSNVETVEVGIAYDGSKPEVDVVIATPSGDPPVDELAEVVADEVGESVTVDIQVVETDRARVDVESP